jgi:phosphate uptake regulator
MQKRKIQKIGGSSFSLVLPKEWVLANGAQKEVELARHSNGALLVYGPKHGQFFKTTVEVLGKSKSELFNEIINFYSLGFDEINICGPLEKNVRRNIREVMGFLVGFEIISETSEKIVLKSVLGAKELSFDQCLQSMAVSTKSMLDDAVEAFLSRDAELARDVISRDIDVDKLYHLITRYHQSLLQDKIAEDQSAHSPLESNAYEYIASQVERVADHAVRIAAIVAEGNSFAIDKKSFLILSRFYSRSEKLFAEIMEKNLDHKRIIRLLGDLVPVNREIRLFKSEMVRRQFVEGVLFLESLERVGGYIENILQKRFQRLFFSKMI